MSRDIGILLLRVCFSLMMLAGHGWGKLASFTEKMHVFPDPIGLGSPISLALATFAEVFCAAAVMVGFMTRWACIPLVITMLVAVFIFHWEGPWGKKEMALLYLVPFMTLYLTGPGRFSIDRIMGRER